MATIYRQGTMSTSDVKKMQQALVDKGYSVGSSGVDGIWGKDTAAALSQFKSDTGGSNSYGNSVGNETFKKLYGSSSSGSSGSSSSSGSSGSKSGGAIGQLIGALTNPDVLNAAAIAGAYQKQQQQMQEQFQQQMMQMQQQYEQQLGQYQNMEAMYGQMYEQMAAQNAQNTAAAQQRIQQTVDSIKANEGKINDAYAQAQREAYINSVLQGNQMGDYLQAMGYNGGMAESTMGQLSANYENNRRQATSERDNALRQNEQLIAEAEATGNAELADIANNYYNNMVGALQNQAQLNYQIAQDQQAQANADREYQLALQQQQFAQQMQQQQYDDEKNAYKDSQSQTQAEADFNTFLNTYAGKYNKKATYEQWIKNLEAMDDPYGYNKQKIAYLRQYINKNFNSGSSGGSGTTAGTVRTSDTTTDIQGSTNNTYKGLNFQIQTMLMDGTTRLLSGKNFTFSQQFTESLL